MTDRPLLDRACDSVAQESGLAVVVTSRADGTAQASVVNAGVLDHPVTALRVVGLVARGGTRKLAHLRARPRATVVFRSGWEWVAVEGDAELIGPDDAQEGVHSSEVARLRRTVYAAAVGGTADEWAALDEVMDAERHTAASRAQLWRPCGGVDARAPTQCWSRSPGPGWLSIRLCVVANDRQCYGFVSKRRGARGAGGEWQPIMERANGWRPRRSVVTLVLAVALLTPTLAAGASPTQQDPRQQRDQVRKEKAAAAQDVDALRASDTEVKQALADIQANLSGQMAALDDARLAETQANEAVRQARLKEQAVQSQIAAIKDQLREVAVRAYVDGGLAPQVFDSFGSTQMDDLLRQTLLGFQATRSVGLADQLRAAEEDLALARQAAETNAAIAAQKRAEIEQRVGEVQAAQRQQAAYVADVETRLDQRLSEAANLSVLDKQLSNQIAAQEAALAARLPSGGPSGTGSAPIADFPLTTVRGITVASSIAAQLEQMLNAAEADGVAFGGSGYRDSNQQWELRKQNCPDPANSPPSACSPPTARAGASMHERGLAIDFNYGGRIVSSGDPGYRWLSANAGRFGFSNLAGEPWHWSTSGR